MNWILSSFAFFNCNFITLSFTKFLFNILCLYIDFLEKLCLIVKLGLNQSLYNTFNFYFKLGSFCSNPTRKSAIKIVFCSNYLMAFLAVAGVGTITWTQYLPSFHKSYRKSANIPPALPLHKCISSVATSE
jgi:hypothetical protein